MALTGDFAAMQRLRDRLESADVQRDAAHAVVIGGRALMRAEFASSTDPSGDPWVETTRGVAALASKNLQNVVGGVVVGDDEAAFSSGVDWLGAHNAGHEFPARTGGGQSTFFDRAGRKIKMGALSKRALKMKFIEERVAAHHRVGARVLPRRQIRPDGGAPLPPAWAEMVRQAAAGAMKRALKK